MADELPVAEAPVAAPVVTESAAVVASPEPSPPPAPAVEPAAVVAAEPIPDPVAEVPSIPETPPSVLGDAGKPAPVTAEETAPVVVEEPPAEEAPAPAYEPFTLPEGVSLKDEDVARFTEFLGEIKATQEAGQKMMDMYIGGMQQLQTEMQKGQYDAFHQTRDTWRNEFFADPEIGGNRRDTTIKTCGAILEQYGSPALREMLNYTGAGDHPEMIRFINKIGKVLGEGRPVAAAKPVPQVQSKATRRYANMNGSA